MHYEAVYPGSSPSTSKFITVPGSILLRILSTKLPLIWSKLNAPTGIRTRYLEKSTLVFIREVPLKIFQISSEKKLAKFFDKIKIQFFFIFRHFSILKGIPFKNFKGISLIKTKVDFSRYRVRIPVGALSFDHIKGSFVNKILRRIEPGTQPPQSH